jgi:hypothetical protein
MTPQVIHSLIMFALLIGIGAVGTAAASAFNKELRKSHFDRWNALGQPFTRFFRSIASTHDGVRWMAFIALRRYAKLNNRRLTMLGDYVLICWLINLAIVVSWAVATHGRPPLEFKL